MARGGARPGAGRPRKGTVPVKQTATSDEVVRGAAAVGLTPLEYMLAVMRDADEDPARRDRMAIAAAPFVHERAADARPGKKEQAAARAKTAAAAGKFANRRPPALKVVGA